MSRKTENSCLEFILIDLTQYVSTNKSYISIYEIHNNMITIIIAAVDTLNAQICKANKPDYFMKSNRGKVSRQSESSALVRVTVAKVNENKAYTGLLAFSKQKCGRDFLDGIVDGRLS